MTRMPGTLEGSATGEPPSWNLMVHGLSGLEFCTVALIVALTISVFGHFRNQ